MRKATLIDLNSLLQLLNGTIAIGIIFQFNKLTENLYVDVHVILAAVLIHAQIFAILIYEKRRTNPFIIILSLVVILFYLLRVLTLAIDDTATSLVFSRPGSYDIGSPEIYEFLIYLHFCIWAIFLGIKQGNGPLIFAQQRINACKFDRKEYKLYARYAFIGVVIFILQGYVLVGNSAAFNPGLIFGIIATLFNYEYIITLFIFLLLLNRNEVSKKARMKVFIVLITMLTPMIIVGGGSGPVLKIGLPMLYALLVIYGRVKIRLMIVVLVFFIGIILSLYGTYTKFNKIEGQMIPNRATLYEINQLSLEDYQKLLLQIYARAAFLDFSVEIINNKKYREIINLEHHFEAIVDAMTPGFDVYNTPLAANALQGIYRTDLYSAMPRRSELHGAAYQSDQINVFAEYNVLFGTYLSLPLLLLSAYIGKISYLYFQTKTHDKFFGLFLSAILLNQYWCWLKSFGLDWNVVEGRTAVMCLVFIYIYVKASSNRSATSRGLKGYQAVA